MCNRFAMFPNHLLRAGLTLREQSVLLCLLSYRNGDRQAWPSQTTISADTSIDISHVRRAIKSLAQKGMIAMETQAGVRTVYTFPCLDAQPAPAPEPVREPAPAPVVAKNATAAVPAPVATPEPKPAPVATPEPAPAPEQPTADNLSRVAEQVPVSEPVAVATPQPQTKPAPVQQPVVAPAPVATPAPEPAPAPAQQPVAKPQPEPAPAPVSVAPTPALEPLPPAPAQPRAQQPVPAPVAAPTPALEPAPPTPRRITSARVARLPDVDEAVRREVDARPVVKSSSAKPVDDAELMARAKRLQALCAENTARSREQKAAAQRFMDGVTAATEQVAKQVAAQDIAAARQRAAQDAAAAKPEQQAVKPEQQAAKTEEQAETGIGGDVIPGNGRNVEQRPAPEQPAPAAEKTTDEQNADAARDAAGRDGCYPVGEKTNAPEPVVPAPVVVQKSPEPAPQQALPIICEPQPPATTPQQGELLPAPAKQSRSVKTVAIQGELLPEEGSTRGSCLPKNWYLPREWGVWAMERFGFSEDEVRYQADKFRDHWISTTRNSTKKNWFATWRNWMRKAHERGEKGITYSSTKKSKMTQALDNLANMKLDWEHPEKWNPFAEMTPEEREAARKRDEARAAARIAEAARKRDEAKRNRDAE